MATLTPTTRTTTTMRVPFVAAGDAGTNMQKLPYSELLRLLIVASLLVLSSGCAINMTRYTDGPLTQYLSEPIPQLNQPIARTLSLEKVMFQTAASFKATMISDMVAREIYIMPEDVGRKVKSAMGLDEEYSTFFRLSGDP